MNTTGDRAAELVNRRHAEQVEFLRHLVRTPSDNPPGDCAPHAARAAELLEDLGFEVERHEVPAEMAARARMLSVTNLVVRRRFGQGPTVALNAHGDVVPPGEGWVRDPYGGEIEHGCLYGRGAAVSKSDFATYAFALLAAADADGELRGAVELHFTYDEETGGELGPKWLLDEGISVPDYAICAGLSYGVVTTHNGCLHLEVRVRGQQAHAALPLTGADALEAATAILSDLYNERDGLEATRSSVTGIEAPTLVVGTIAGGVNTNVVPDLVTLRIDRRIIPEEDAGTVERRLRDRITEVGGRFDGVTVEMDRVLLAQPLLPQAGTDRLAAILTDCATAVMGERVETHGVPLYTDARHYANAGVPTVLYGAGPRDAVAARAHAADEHVHLDDLRRATEVVARALVTLLQGTAR